MRRGLFWFLVVLVVGLSAFAPQLGLWAPGLTLSMTALLVAAILDASLTLALTDTRADLPALRGQP